MKAQATSIPSRRIAASTLLATIDYAELDEPRLHPQGCSIVMCIQIETSAAGVTRVTAWPSGTRSSASTPPM